MKQVKKAVEDLGDTKHLRNILLLLGIFTGFVFIITFSTIYVSDAIKNNNVCGCVIPVPVMILILSSLGVFVGAITSYLFLSRLLIIRADLSKQKKFSSDIVLRLLDLDERKVVEFLIENKGSAYQSKISSLLLDRVKAHRIVSKLNALGLVTVVKDKKSNIINLNPDFYEMMKE